MSTLTASGLTCRRAGRTVFADLSFSVASGERLAVLGPSGSGKTTLLSLLAGLAEPAAGRMTLDDVELGPRTRHRFALVLQGYGLVSLLSAAENVEAALRAAGRPAREAIELARAALEDVGLDGLEDHLIEELSGGQQQRVAVARALALRPDVLLADEPTAEQDPGFRALVLSRLLAVADHGGIVVLATHDPEVAARCTAAVHIRPGSDLTTGPSSTGPTTSTQPVQTSG
jgi:putative ABC transport system ATP-binding protein